MALRRCVALAAGLSACLASGCGVRAPSPVDLPALIRREHGPVEARRSLELRVLSDPRDVQSRLALAALCDDQHRPSEAIDQLERVLDLGGPLGPRWRAADRERLGRLLAARGRLRSQRGSATALHDLQRAKGFGARISDDDLRTARVALALGQLRHVDAAMRDRGLANLRALASQPGADPAWRGALANASPSDRGLLGAWLWSRGARRAAWTALSAWAASASAHDAASAALEASAPDAATSDRPGARRSIGRAWLAAARWWTPVDAAIPAPPSSIGGASRCLLVPCAPTDLLGEDDEIQIAFAHAPPIARTTDPRAVTALAILSLRSSLRGEASWGSSLAARVDLAAIPLASLPEVVRPIIARLQGRSAPIPSEAALSAANASADEHLLAAAERALAGDPTVSGVSGAERALTPLAQLSSPHAAPVTDPFTSAVSRYVLARVPDSLRDAQIAAILRGYRRDPGAADRAAADAVAEAPDAAIVQAALGTLFSAIGDPARARTAWQAAVDASAEPAFVLGLAEAQARAADPDAALITATVAAAASGDPAAAWIVVARALDANGHHVHALDAARFAIDLASPETIAPALDVAIAASRALDRRPQLAALLAQRARAVLDGPHLDTDPTDATGALVAYSLSPTAGSLARVWVASRWNPRDVSTRALLLAATNTDDPRRAVATAELVALAADRDPDVGRAAVSALR